MLNPLHRDNYAYDREAWALERRTYERLLTTLRRMGRVVVLSGDVHYGFGAVLESWEQGAEAPAPCRLVSFTSSSLRNEAEGVNKVLLAALHPQSLPWLSRAEMHPIEEFVWERSGILTVCQAALRAVSSPWWRVFWAIVRQVAQRHPKALLVLPTSGWSHGTFDAAPPEVRTRLRYLRAAHPSSTGNFEDWPVGERASGGQPESATSATASAVPNREDIHVSEADEREFPYPTFHHLGWVLQSARERPSTLEHWLVGYRTDRLKKQAKHHRLAMPHTESKDYLVTRTNLGEIRFDWERKEAIQGLWYPAASDNDQLSVAVALFRASLESPPADEAPRLP